MRVAPQEIRTYFVTSVTAQRRRFFQVAAHAELLHRTLSDYRDQGRFHLHAFVIMRDHFHAIITPAPEVSLEKAMQYIKGGFSFRLRSKQDVWMRSFNETQILNEEKFTAAVRYIEQNPVRRGLVLVAADYAYSSAACKALDPMPAHLRKAERVEGAGAFRTLNHPQ
jgi:REP-associated tyrosine transposase